MTQPLTDLQGQRQNETVTTQWQGAAPTELQDNGGTVPNVYAQMDLTKQAANPINPPSTAEIHKQMWIGSFMMALMAGLAGGNPAAAIVGGMWGAIGIHDYGNTLQQRAKQVPQLQKDGYSMRAILKWYEDGDNSELDKERDYKLRAQEHTDTVQHQKDEMQQRKTFHDEDLAQRKADSAARIGMERQRMAEAAQYHKDMLQRQNAGAGWSALGHFNSLANGIYRPVKERVTNLNAKQNYIDQVMTAVDQMKRGNPVAYNALLTGLAGMDNPNAVPKEGAIERLDEIGGLSESLRNKLEKAKSGVFTTDTINEIQSFANAHQADIDTQRQKIFNQAAASAENSLHAAGIADPDGHAAKAVGAQVAAGTVEDDPFAATAPALASNEQQTQQAEQQQGKEKPSQSDVDDVMKKYGHSAK